MILNYCKGVRVKSQLNKKLTMNVTENRVNSNLCEKIGR